jgi:hypothetical protein
LAAPREFTSSKQLLAFLSFAGHQPSPYAPQFESHRSAATDC